jgi:hypothetical protein
VPWVLFALLPVEAIIIWRVIVVGADLRKMGTDVQHEVEAQGQEMQQMIARAFEAGAALLMQAQSKETDGERE